jgi:hypothetical protein
MKHYLVLALAALAFAIVAPSAFATRVIFDPPEALSVAQTTVQSATCKHDDPCSISILNQPYTVGFIHCSEVEGVSTGNNTWCLWMNNVTLHAASKFTFQFAVPEGGSHSGSALECFSIPADFATDNCPQTLPNPGEMFTVSFFAHPALPNRTDFYLFTDFVNSPGTAEVTVSVPEPGALGLFGLGLLGIGLGLGWQRRRNNFAA